MDCEACTDRLVELLYEELAEEDTQRTRAHLEGCEACADAYARISMGSQFGALLELVDPPASVLDSVMATAREKAAQRAPDAVPTTEERATPPRPEPDDDDGVWAALLRWVGGGAMRPQLAMAMSLLLMVGLGMWYLPTLRQGDPADRHAIVDPAPGDEVGPSASLEPAQPLDLEANPRTGRILPREDPPVRSTPRSPRASAPPEVAVVTEAVVPEELAPEPEEVDRAELDRAASPARPVVAALADGVEEAAPDPRVAIAEQSLAPGQRSGAAHDPPASGAPQRGLELAYEADDAPTPSPTPGEPEEGSAADTARYERGLRRFRERNYRGAADDFESVIERPGRDGRRLIPSALHHLARSQRAAQNCPAAVRSYERLLRQHASYSGAPEAMIEVAACHERLGRLSEARRWLERARSRPSVAARANRQLAVIAQRERARSVVPAAAPASAY